MRSSTQRPRAPRRSLAFAVIFGLFAALTGAPAFAQSTVDPNKPDKHYGKPDPANLPKPAKGWASNQDPDKPTKFPHYGRVAFKLCDLPVDKDKGEFRDWTPAQQRAWARKQLPDMTADYTNHELVEGTGADTVFVIYKVWKTDHQSEAPGRPLLYHPRQFKDPKKPELGVQDKAYEGGIAQLARLPAHMFKKEKPAPKKKDKKNSLEPFTALFELVLLTDEVRLPGEEPIDDDDAECESEEECVICGPCAQSPETAADWCGEGEGSCP